ncbi:hypothetical protein B9Z55_027734 [Caenorhabditis nigoni]|uniref:Serpentine receptor class gamma n=1 Tax=Caenorhabditis nigoni TaxID=1611254 RepID=A0A2G5SE73_9PELO|nr:hypothetical protein B9Z55_027734 [Caenorhabditis nigoni]
MKKSLMEQVFLIVFWLAFLFFIFLIILLICIFPFFLMVYSFNYYRDRETTIFSITKHFYNAIRLFYLGLSFLVAYFIFEIKYFTLEEKFTSSSVPTDLIIMSLIGILLVIFVHTHHFILSVLAIQRFYLYFFWNTESFKDSTWFLKWTYFVFYGFHILFFISVKLMSENSQAFVSKVYSMAYPIYYIGLNMLLFSAALLYIPIFLSVRKLEHLVSAKFYKPHKYILNQTKLILAFKTAHFLVWIFWIYRNGGTFFLYCVFCIIDLISTPVTIQMSYLYCSKRNVQTLKFMFSKVFNGLKVEPFTLQNEATIMALS